MVAATASTLAQNALATPSAQTQQTSSSGGFSFHDILNIVNPLQHLPVISTIYRAVTGDKINDFEKVAGDTLYGGVVGFVSSMADTIFEAVTGKDFGDTVLGLITGDDDKTGVANASTPSSDAQVAQQSDSAPVTGVTPFAAPQVNLAPDSSVSAPQLAQLASFAPSRPTATAASANIVPSSAPGISALMQSLNRSGVDPETAKRAADAYRRAVGLAPTPTPASATPPIS
jgi:hypothetical protein